MEVAFKRNAAGIPVRLIVTDAPSSQIMQNFPGAVTAVQAGTFTLPLDNIYVYRLQKMFCNVADDVLEWVTKKLQDTKDVVKILEQADAPGDSRLRPFQRVDVEFMKAVPVVLNANAMGTGKTVETYAYINDLEPAKVLIVCSKSKMQDWEDEGDKWVTGEKTFVQVKGNRTQKEKLLKDPSRFVIMNYEAARAPEVKNGKRVDLPGLWGINFDIVVFDEAHRLKNKRAKRTGGAIKLVSQAQRAVFLTGTPMVNAPQELFPILHMTDPLRFSSYWTFVDRFCQLEENPFANVPKITGVKNLDHLQFILTGIMVRREKKDVLPELPDKIYKNIRIDLELAQKKLYKQLKKEMLVEFENGNNIVTVNVVSLMIRLRQICCSPSLVGAGFSDSAKTDAFFDIIDEFIETGEKLIVFSFFKSYLKLLSEELTRKKVKHVLTTGETPSGVREQNKHQFEHDPETNLFMITTSTGGEGLNLQYASNVLFLDKPWTPAEMHQAEDRVHRMGQTKSPLIMSITCKGTIEEYINKVIETKDDMITQTMAMERVMTALLAEGD